MKVFDYCKFCAKPGRLGEGYIVVSYRNGLEVTRPCPSCSGFGYSFVAEIEPSTELDLTDYTFDPRN